MRKGIALIIALVSILAISAIGIQIGVAQSVGNIIINADGSVTGTNSIQQSGNTYTLIANISGSIQVRRSDIVIDGSGYTFDGKGTGGIDLNDLQLYPTLSVSNVTIENLYIVNGGVGTNGGGNDTLYNDYISNSGPCIMLIEASYNNITYCNLNSTNDEAIGMMEGASYNTITENNIVGGVNMFLSTGETIDQNYWGDYLTKYPNATEVDHSGKGNTPYVYYKAQNIAPNGTKTPIIYQDNQPLMKPVTIPLTGSSPESTIPEFSSIIVIALVLAVISGTAVILMNKKSTLHFKL